MAGEYYNQAELGCPPGTSLEAFALQCYEREGDLFACKLKGSFIILIWDAESHKLILTNDRFGTYNLFYAHHPNRLVFAPEMKGVLCDPAFRKELDMVALAQYMRFQQLLGRRTFFEGLSLLPAASVLTYLPQTGAFQVQPYWTYAEIPHNPKISLAEAVEETGRRLRKAVQVMSGDALRPGVFLSGGMDGRTITGLVERRPLATLNFGVKNCSDVVYAARIARAAGTQHHWVEFKDGKWVLERMDQYLELTEGFHSFIHMHGISGLPLARQVMDVNLSGWDGGTTIGYPDDDDILQYDPVSEEAFITRQFYLYNQVLTWPGLTEEEELGLYHDRLGREMRGLAFDSLRAELQPFLDYRRDVRHEFFFIDTQCRRMTHYMVVFGRSFIEQRFPFFDYDVIDFTLSLPNEMRLDFDDERGTGLYRGVVQKEIPHLAQIPYNVNHLPPTTIPWRRGLAVWKNRLKRAIHKYALPIFPPYLSLYADYENYLRTDLAQWAQGVLSDPRTRAHEIFNPSSTDSLLKRHLSGRELHTIGKIAPIITYELMLRRFFD